MNFQEFTEKIKEMVQEKIGDVYTVRIHESLKNNNKKCVALDISKEKETIAPRIYLERFFEDFQQGGSLNEVAEEIIQQYADHRIASESSPDFSWTRNWEEIKGRVFCKLINKEWNLELLKDTPHKDFLDMAVTLYITVQIGGKEEGSIRITNTLLLAWGISLEEVYQTALKNTVEKMSPVFQGIEDILKEAGLQMDLDLGEAETSIPMYVLSNEAKTFGAASILFRETLKGIGETLGCDYYVLPSSVHEVIIVPESIGQSPEELAEMVSDINRDMVEEEEVLSNTVYCYNGIREELCVA